MQRILWDLKYYKWRKLEFSGETTALSLSNLIHTTLVMDDNKQTSPKHILGLPYPLSISSPMTAREGDTAHSPLCTNSCCLLSSRIWSLRSCLWRAPPLWLEHKCPGLSRPRWRLQLAGVLNHTSLLKRVSLTIRNPLLQRGDSHTSAELGGNPQVSMSCPNSCVISRKSIVNLPNNMTPRTWSHHL